MDEDLRKFRRFLAGGQPEPPPAAPGAPRPRTAFQDDIHKAAEFFRTRGASIHRQPPRQEPPAPSIPLDASPVRPPIAPPQAVRPSLLSGFPEGFKLGRHVTQSILDTHRTSPHQAGRDVDAESAEKTGGILDGIDLTG